MSKDYRKKCSNCAAEIIMSDATGKWQPMNPDNSIHRCIVVQTPQNGKPVIDETSKDLANRVTFLENELKKLKEWLAIMPLMK